MIVNPRVLYKYFKLRIDGFSQKNSLKKRIKIARYAFNHVPIYREKYKNAGINSSNEIRTKDDFENLPIITKDDLRSRNHDFFSDIVDKKFAYKSTTGGSTGKPIEIYHDKRYPSEILNWRFLSWWKLNPLDSEGNVWRDVNGMHSKVSLKQKIKRWPKKIIFLDASKISTEEALLFLNKLKKNKIKILRGYVGGIDFLADIALINNIKLPHLKIVWATAAPITKIFKNKIKKAFNTPVIDQYGCGEIYWLAANSPYSGDKLHFFSDARYIEFVDDNYKPIKKNNGSILLTDLENYLFPLIRYENGDRGSWCKDNVSENKINLPLIEPIKGRISESLKLSDGTVLSGEYFTQIFDDYPNAVSQYQVHQKSYDLIVLRVVPEKTYQKFEYEILEVKKNMEQLISNKSKVKIEFVDAIASDAGKNRYILSDVSL